MEQISTVEFEKKFDNNGYILVLIDGVWRREHKYIVEQFIGRELTKEEVVHHINSIRSDNRISNLMLFNNQKEHQKFHNKVRQFGYTRPILRQIANRWNKYNEVSQ